jgi:hypothetical protein
MPSVGRDPPLIFGMLRSMKFALSYASIFWGAISTAERPVESIRRA